MIKKGDILKPKTARLSDVEMFVAYGFDEHTRAVALEDEHNLGTHVNLLVLDLIHDTSQKVNPWAALVVNWEPADEEG